VRLTHFFLKGPSGPLIKMANGHLLKWSNGRLSKGRVAFVYIFFKKNYCTFLIHHFFSFLFYFLSKFSFQFPFIYLFY